MALVSVLIGKPFAREYVAAEQPADVIKTGLFERTAQVLTWIWVAVFAATAVSSLVPPICAGANASLLDTRTPLSYVFTGSFRSRCSVRRRWRRGSYPTRCSPASTTSPAKPHSSRTTKPPSTKSTLAQEHANGEVGPGKGLQRQGRRDGNPSPETSPASRGRRPTRCAIASAHLRQPNRRIDRRRRIAR